MTDATDTDAAEAPHRTLRQRPALLAALVAGVILALLVALLVTRDPVGEKERASKLIGKPAPALGGKVILGEPFDLGASDRWTVVNFFASWCVPCANEHPELKAFAEEHADDGLAQVVSVVYGDSAGDVRRFFEKKGGDWTVLDSDEGRTALDWGVAKVPESFIVSPNGIVVERFATGNGVTKAQLDAVIAAFDEGGS